MFNVIIVMVFLCLSTISYVWLTSIADSCFGRQAGLFLLTFIGVFKIIRDISVLDDSGAVVRFHTAYFAANYERARDDGLLLIFISNSELFLRHSIEGTWEAFDGKFTCYNNSPSSLARL